MMLGDTPEHGDLFRSGMQYCRGQVSATSLYQLLHDQGRTCWQTNVSELF